MYRIQVTRDVLIQTPANTCSLVKIASTARTFMPPKFMAWDILVAKDMMLGHVEWRYKQRWSQKNIKHPFEEGFARKQRSNLA